MSKIKYNILKPFVIEFTPASLDENQIAQKVNEFATDYHLTTKQEEILRQAVIDASWNDDELASPIFYDEKQLATALSLFAPETSPIAQRNFILSLFHTMSYTDLAQYTNIPYLDHLVVSDFVMSPSGNFIIFTATCDKHVSLDALDEYLDGQISDGWGENGTDEQVISTDVREMSKEMREELMRYSNDILLSSYMPRFASEYDKNNQPIFFNGSKLLINDMELTMMSRMANNIKVQAFVKTSPTMHRRIS